MLRRPALRPAGHVLGPFDGVNAEVGAAIDCDNAVAIVRAAQIEQFKQQRDFVRIVGSPAQKLVTNAESIFANPVLIEAVYDHGAVIG